MPGRCFYKCTLVWKKKILMHKGEHPGDYFFQFYTYGWAERVRKGAVCVQIC